jgi:N-formylmaleamate deformylase
MAENMRKTFSGPATPETDKQAEASIRGMVTKPEDFQMILGWSKKSDRIAEGNAMYEMMTTDLRENVSRITAPAIVIGTWIGLKDYGVTREQVEKNFRAQYAKLKTFQFVLSDKARHFVMLDDPEGFFEATDGFLLGSGKSTAATQ